MYLPEQFDHVALMSLGAQRDDASEHGTRVAVLGFCTTQYYTAVLRGIGKATGFPVVTYEPEYNTVHQTVIDDQSKLYSFEPDFVVFLTAVQALRSVLLATDVAERAQLVEREIEDLVSLVKRASTIAGVTVVVHELVVPYERAWGNFTGRVAESFPNHVRRINERLQGVADETANVYTIDSNHIASWLGKRAWFDERLWFYSKSFCHPEALPHVASQAMDIFQSLKGRGIKCIALDLDNTLWGGTIGDDGLEGIRLGHLGDGEAYVYFQSWLKELGNRGILLAVCSKNDEERAREPFRQHTDMVLAESDIACFIANWQNKADNLRLVANRLSLGLDSMAFLDDSPVERNLVRELVPEVSVTELPSDPADFVPYLESLNMFEATRFSDEDRRRTSLYRADSRRTEERIAFSDVNAYLASLEMEATFERFDKSHLPRIAQLVQRTNQFNLTTIRHSDAELEHFGEDLDYFPFYVTLIDRFGDNGLISVVIGRRANDAMDIVTWLMSCRVVSRRVEEFVLDQLVEAARTAGITQLRGRYVPTEKNGLVSKHYEELGFLLAESLPDGSTTWYLDLDEYVSSSSPIRRRALDH